MKRRTRIFSATIVLLLCMSLFVLAFRNAQTKSIQKNRSTSIVVTLIPIKNQYFLGEVVAVDITVVNKGTNDVPLCGTSIKSGCVQFFIARQDKEFELYTDLGVRTRTGLSLKSGQSQSSRATLFANGKPQVERLNSDAAETISKGRIRSDYAFPESGTYSIKAQLVIPNEISTRIESNTVQVQINEPEGDDLNVWEAIKGSSEIAFFVQYRAIASSNAEKREALVNQIEQVVNSNPNGTLAKNLEKGLEEFRAKEVKSKEAREKLRKPPPKSN